VQGGIHATGSQAARRLDYSIWAIVGAYAAEILL